MHEVQCARGPVCTRSSVHEVQCARGPRLARSRAHSVKNPRDPRFTWSGVPEVHDAVGSGSKNTLSRVIEAAEDMEVQGPGGCVGQE